MNLFIRKIFSGKLPFHFNIAKNKFAHHAEKYE